MQSLVSRKGAVVVILFLAVGGLSFYGGRVYQNNIDQPLFSQYTPQARTRTSGAGAAGTSFFGNFSSGGSQVAAALALATPPGGSNAAAAGATSNSQSPASTAGGSNQTPSTTSTNSGASGSGSRAPAATPAAGQSSATTAAAGGTDLSGSLISAAAAVITIKPAQGSPVTINATGSTAYYVADKVAASALAAGQRVTVSLQPGGAQGQGFTADSVTIAPAAGQLYGFVKQAQAAAAGAAGGFRFSPAGTVASVSNGTLNLRTSTGRAFAVSLSSSTSIYKLDSVQSSKIPAGAMVSVHEASSGKSATAQNVVATTASGLVASLTTPPARRVGAGGGFGGNGGGGNGGGGGGGN
ncbi:MAG TPA: hypothetical protein VGP33_11390 [Chloroflexota bacterium]|nr:hypothetical protein [Chloroflexota bacterium]